MSRVGRRLAWVADRYTQREPLRFVGATVLIVSLAMLAVMFATESGGRTLPGPPLGGDFTGFYAAGKLLNEQPPERLYNLTLHDEYLHALFPEVSRELSLPFVQPPYLSVFFRPLGWLSYRWAFALWLSVSIALLGAGLVLIRKACPAIPAADWLTIGLLVLSFEPLLVECLIGGQTSTLGLFSLAAAIQLERRGRPVLAGLALSICLYKPTLLVLVLPMLVIGLRWRVLAGFATGGAALAGVALWGFGLQGCFDYLRLARVFGQAVSEGTLELPPGKFVDLTSVQRCLGWGRPQLASLVTLGVALAATPWMAMAWWRSRKSRAAGGSLAWAFTLTASLVLNVYVGVYDSAVVVLSVLLTLDALSRDALNVRGARSGGLGLTPAFRALVFLLYVTPWFSPFLAVALGVQPYTFVLALLAAYQLKLALAEPRVMAPR